MEIKKYRKKPIVIEAIKLTQEKEVINKIINFVGSINIDLIIDDGIVIKTLEGNHLARWGDYIIKGIHGEFYPCKPDIFHKTYEEVK